jgi:hypothetical protein
VEIFATRDALDHERDATVPEMVAISASVVARRPESDDVTPERAF